MKTTQKNHKYSIRKCKASVGSILIAICLLHSGLMAPSTVFATTSANTELADANANAKVEEVRNLVKELEQVLADLEQIPSYGDDAEYSYQKSLWESFFETGKKNMVYALNMPANDQYFDKIKGNLMDFKYQIKVEEYTRQVAEFRKKYPGDGVIEEEYKQHLKQGVNNSIASQEGDSLRGYVDGQATPAMEKIRQRVAELDKLKEVPTPAPEVPSPSDESLTPTPDAPNPSEENLTPSPDAPTPVPGTPNPSEEDLTPSPGVPSPLPNIPSPSDKIPEPMPKIPTPQPAPRTPRQVNDTKVSTPVAPQGKIQLPNTGEASSAVAVGLGVGLLIGTLAFAGKRRQDKSS